MRYFGALTAGGAGHCCAELSALTADGVSSVFLCIGCSQGASTSNHALLARAERRCSLGSGGAWLVREYARPPKAFVTWLLPRCDSKATGGRCIRILRRF
jgi:hypothetical protein